MRRRPQGVGEGAALTLSAEPVVAVTPVAVSRASEKERLLKAVAFGVCLTALAALWFLIPAGISWLAGLLLQWPALPADSPQLRQDNMPCWNALTTAQHWFPRTFNSKDQDLKRR